MGIEWKKVSELNGIAKFPRPDPNDRSIIDFERERILHKTTIIQINNKEWLY